MILTEFGKMNARAVKMEVVSTAMQLQNAAVDGRPKMLDTHLICHECGSGHMFLAGPASGIGAWTCVEVLRFA